MPPIRRLVIQLVLLLAALFALYLLVVFLPAIPGRTFSGPRTGAQQSTPVPTPESARIAASPHSFQYLVAFTPRGFEPAELTIKKGETVRFTNNTASNVQFIASSGSENPRTVAPHQYAEWTYEKKGSYPYSDALSKQSGILRVE